MGTQFVAHADFPTIPFWGYCGKITLPKSMKRISVYAAVAVLLLAFLTSCSTQFHQIGQLNMISTRNVESQSTYVLLKSYAGGTEKEMKTSRATTVDMAIDQTVKSVPGGEFMKNVKIFMVVHRGKFYYAAQGDVWGLSGEITYRGFKVGDKVTWKTKSMLNGTTFNTGVITSLKDDKTCLVKDDKTSATVELSYDDITKSSQ